MRDLSALTADDFERCKGETFAVPDGDSEPTDLMLTVVSRLGQHRGHRDPFSLLFVGSPTPFLPQGLYHLDHPVMGELELFLVPIGADRDGVTYEAVFA
ncbi:MAG: hypothetical protein QOG44_1877 [Acidimicrobiaceae bacterium]|jgi:hypothetical protein|nr:hypothetical protein [Acidimicrobiaceae bacterium]